METPEPSRRTLFETSKYPSTTVHHGALPESWFPQWLFRYLERRWRKQSDRSPRMSGGAREPLDEHC